MFGDSVRFKHYIGDIEMVFRSLPVVEDIRKSGLDQSKILEVGGGDFGIAPFLNKKITVADINFTRRVFRLVNPVIVRGVELPFDDNSFDVVVSIDMLEHIPPKKRKKSVEEMVRIARKKIYLVIPEGKYAEQSDKRIREEYLGVNLRDYRFLEEHVKYGLPTAEEVRDFFGIFSEKYNKKLNIEVRDNLNIKFREMLLRVWIRKNLISKILFKLFAIFLPFRKFLNFGICYRKVFIVDIKE